ncbi:MAG: hypothetical protein GYB65_14085, partial [Chloroflexi bacterium]|nr:hypothetical protein [Chloroflexota bacterium]
MVEIPIPERSVYYRQLTGRGVVLLIVTYVLALGGTYSGILNPGIRQVSLGLLTGGIVLWSEVTRRRP